jgi:hypothetical protein
LQCPTASSARRDDFKSGNLRHRHMISHTPMSSSSIEPRKAVPAGAIRLDHLGHQCSHAPGRPNLHLVSSSRRPRLEPVDRVTSSLAPHIAQFLCSSRWLFLRPGPQSVDLVARRGGQGRPSRLACGRLWRCQAAP